MTGEIKTGSPVKTLHFTRAVYGRVIRMERKHAFVVGRTQPGAGVQRFKAHIENLDLVTEDDLAPEDRIDENAKQ